MSISPEFPSALLNQEFKFSLQVPKDALHFHFLSALVSNAFGELREPQGSV